MKTIFDYINEDTRKISHIARSCSGSWTIAYKKYDNYSNVSLSSCKKLTDQEVEDLRSMGFVVFDFLKVADSEFLNLFHSLEDLARFNCY